MEKIFKKTSWVFLLIVFAIFWWRGTIFLDPDFGWHLRMGQIILKSGIPPTDPFSYTMPSYPFVDHEWLTNVIIAKLYPVSGQIGLAGIYTALALFALVIAISNPLSQKNTNKRLTLGYLKVMPFVLGTAILLDYSGVRPQVKSWLLLAILFRIILNNTDWEKWHFFLPFFMAVWANLHGSFAVGIAVLFIVLVLKSWREKKLWLKGLIISILSLLATLVNPYGPRLWWEIWQQISDTSLRWTIAEWQPAVFFFNPSFAALLTLSLILVLRYRKRFRLEELGLYFFFLLQGISSLRHIPLWTIVSLPLVVKGLEWFYQEAKNVKEGTLRFEKAYNFAIIGSLFIFTLQAVLSLLGAKSIAEKTFYPKKAVEFLKANLPQGQIFSEYGWGGYLIWQLPEKKVFIDGRMPSWRWETPSNQESGYAMKEYGEITRGKTDYFSIFEKYGIDTVLWPVSKHKKIEKSWEKILVNILAKLRGKENDFYFLGQLEKDNWLKTYEDSVAVIYRRKN